MRVRSVRNARSNASLLDIGDMRGSEHGDVCTWNVPLDELVVFERPGGIVYLKWTNPRLMWRTPPAPGDEVPWVSSSEIAKMLAGFLRCKMSRLAHRVTLLGLPTCRLSGQSGLSHVVARTIL
jgi:hypothetical protein